MIMTGIERLRELAGLFTSPETPNLLANDLNDIADQIERENIEDTEAVEWVREHGGIAYVKDAWNVRSNLGRQLETAKAKVERQQRHIEDVQGKLTERNERIAELERNLSKSVSGQLKADAALYDLRREVLDVCRAHGIEAGDDPLRAIDEAMNRRLMPEGMEWPRFEDGEPVRIGDEVTVIVHDKDGDFDRTLAIRSIKYKENGVLLVGTKNEIVILCHSERVRRPEPKVLDADGVEIRVGDTVYSTRDTGSGTVVYAYPPGDGGQPSVKVGAFWHHASELTHRAPVLAADGRPLEVGQTVWDVESGTEYEVVGIHTDEDSPVRVMRTDGSHLAKAAKPSTLTHQRPVLDAEGNRIEPAMDVWWVCEGDERGIHAEKLHVERVDEDGMVTCSPFNHGTWVELDSSELHVNKPVLAGDGRPLREGETVWKVKNGDGPYHVQEIRDGVSACVEETSCEFMPKELTHERPDSWERWREEWQWPPVKYCKLILGVEYDHDTQLDDAFDAQGDDLVRRAKALAERDA